ncbi:hypothetical protein JIN85_15710 [Luteolibacter pohnpeiensis]|uniref:Secreted protein n=1 Tax=Luteolibacter pohnpeiensis TaxID=454153 RepID=A0A934VXU9_9BACT|nr:hypothetical protein [Luteolibacter pohnpeiensis]MBK1883864.1 hypothetical protein [Luteolibacter pohnpeiensis]
MTRVISALVATVFVLVSASCCCTSDSKPPKLRDAPHFSEIDTTVPAPAEVHYGK